MAEQKISPLVENIKLLDRSMKQTLQGLAVISPFAGMLAGYGVVGAGAIFTGLWLGPVIALSALGAYTYLGLDIKKTVKTAFNLHAKDVRAFVKPANLLERTITGVKKGLGSFMTLLPAGTAAVFAAFGATAMAPGVLLPWAATGLPILAPLALAAAVGLGVAGFTAGGIMASKLTDKIEKNPKEKLFAPTEGATRMDRAKVFLGRVLSYHPQGKPAVHHRHPLSAAAIVGGAVAGAILGVVFSWGTLPIALAGAFIGGAMTLPLQENSARKGLAERKIEVGVSPSDPEESKNRVGVSPTLEPSPLNDLKLSDKFTRKHARPLDVPGVSPTTPTTEPLDGAELAEKYSRKHRRETEPQKVGASPASTK